ncbi:protein LIM1 [Elaeis guineensis]|uniref:Protein LIM2-like n=1 Tax=Elaeis guineensis var. tenera TaxID=51953 RepID=A0A8N4I8M2_ELAGV|nr:protein LIM2-like [Elaeis guineensis]
MGVSEDACSQELKEAMAAAKSFISLPSMSLFFTRVTFVLFLVALAAQSQVAWSQNCSAGLAQLTSCAPYVLPGTNQGPPNEQCCAALRGVDHTCLCNTLNIISRLPSSCNLSPVTCSNNDLPSSPITSS